METCAVQWVPADPRPVHGGNMSLTLEIEERDRNPQKDKLRFPCYKTPLTLIPQPFSTAFPDAFSSRRQFLLNLSSVLPGFFSDIKEKRVIAYKSK